MAIANTDFVHIPILLDEILKIFDLQPGQKVVDLTLGLGGHTEKFCEQVGEDGLVIGIDQDQQAIKRAEKRLEKFPQIRFKHCNFSEIAIVARKNHLPKMNAVLADLGVSSMQFDDGTRGFSFQKEAPLDMRMNQSQETSAAEIVNQSQFASLRDILKKYGEERMAGRIAQAIIDARPIRTTTQLAQVIESVKPRGQNKIHPATKTFQALRIAVNRELQTLEEMLPQAFDLLDRDGRLAIITFHSLEDRIVKTYFQKLTAKCSCPPGSPICTCAGAQAVNLTHKPIVPTAEEIQTNPRARSAKLRAIEKI